MSQFIKLVVLCLILMGLENIGGSQVVPARQRIINGVLASDLAFIVSVHITLNEKEIRICVGSIISDFFILTSATCFFGLPEDNWTGFVRMGTFKLRNEGVTHPFIKMIEHPEFNSTTRENDLLLLEVTNVILFNEYTRSAHIDFSLIRGGARVAVAGWGVTNADDMEKYADELMFVSDETLNTLECQEKISNQTFTVALHFDDSLCIRGMPDGSLCVYDYGAPLIHEDKIIGIWSWGTPACEGGYPYVFTRIAPHINWIAKYRGAPGVN